MTKAPSTKSTKEKIKSKKVSSADTTLGSKHTKQPSSSPSGRQGLQAIISKSASKITKTSGTKKIQLENLVDIPEYIVRQAAEFLNEAYPDEPNNYNKVLIEAEEYYNADMTPIFLLDRTDMTMMVVAKETLGKVLH